MLVTVIVAVIMLLLVFPFGCNTDGQQIFVLPAGDLTSVSAEAEEDASQAKFSTSEPIADADASAPR